MSFGSFFVGCKTPVGDGRLFLDFIWAERLFVCCFCFAERFVSLVG